MGRPLISDARPLARAAPPTWRWHARPAHIVGNRQAAHRGVLDQIEVEWLQRDVSGGDERRTFRKWVATKADAQTGAVADPGPAAGKVYTFNSTELRAVSLTLEPVGPVGGAPLGWWRACGVRPQQLETQRGGGCQGWHRRCTSRWHRHRESCL